MGYSADHILLLIQVTCALIWNQSVPLNRISGTFLRYSPNEGTQFTKLTLTF
jgi:hypothetical protein